MMGKHRLLLVLVLFACVPGAASGSASATSEPERALIRLKPGVPEAALSPTLSALGLKLERSLPQIDVLAVSGGGALFDRALAVLRGHAGVAAAEEEVVLEATETNPNDVHWPSQWGLRSAGFARAWDVARGSSETVVAVVDTGVDRAHPDLRGALLAGYDFVADDADPSDQHGHGTAVAGVLAARANNLTGIAGACWHCRVLPVRVLDGAGRGNSSVVAAGIIWAVDHGATVINLSLGGERASIAEEGAVDYAARHDVLVVASAGNSGSTRRFYPAAHQGVVAVAGTDADDRLYSWSNRGDWVDLAAPGCNAALWRSGAYSTFCGTSSAAPLVAGLAALVRSANPRATAAETARALGSSRLDASRVFPRRGAEVAQPPPRRLARPELAELVRRQARRR